MQRTHRKLLQSLCIEWSLCLVDPGPANLEIVNLGRGLGVDMSSDNLAFILLTRADIIHKRRVSEGVMHFAVTAVGAGQVGAGAAFLDKKLKLEVLRPTRVNVLVGVVDFRQRLIQRLDRGQRVAQPAERRHREQGIVN